MKLLLELVQIDAIPFHGEQKRKNNRAQEFRV